MAPQFQPRNIGTEVARNPVDTKETCRLILPFTKGNVPLVVGNGGAVAAESTPEAQALIQHSNQNGDFYSTIGRTFRSYQ